MKPEETAQIEVGDRLISLFDTAFFTQGEEVICSQLPQPEACDDYAYFYQPRKQREVGASLQGFLLAPHCHGNCETCHCNA